MFAHGPDSPDDDMAQGAAKLALLETYVESDVSGGNPFHGLARNLWSFQANAVGPDALPVNALTEQLAMQLVSTDSVGAFFSVYEATRVGMAVQTLLQTTDAAGVPSAVQGRRVHGVAETARRLMLDRPSVWEAVLATPLSELVAVTDARTKHEILALRIPPIAEYVFDEIGREGVARLLAQTLQRRRGESYTTEEFEALARRNGANLKGALGDWLNDAKLPGFVASDLDVRRIVTDDATTAPYQLLVHIRNDEPTPGPVVLAFEDADTGGRETQSAPIHLAGNQTLEVGLLAQREPDRIWFAPYLSLNRGRIYLTLPDVEWRTLAADASALPFVGSRGSTWQPTAIHGVLVDDLSPGFRIANSPHEGMRLKGNPTDNVAELDHGVPIWTTLGEGWQRQVIAGAVGKYRHTIVRTGPGDGNAWAIFTANLPVSGRWRAEYHLPVGTLDQLGSYGIEVMTDHPGVRSGAVFEDRIEFDGSAAQVGWNPLGEFEVTEATTIRMSVSDETTGTSVVADAVRWIRVVATER